MEIAQLPLPQLGSIKKQLDEELEHLTLSMSRLRTAQAKFRECVESLQHGASSTTESLSPVHLVPLTTSLYIPGNLIDHEHVMVDIGTGFLIEKTRGDATNFYSDRANDLDQNLRDVEGIIQDKASSLRVLEDVMRRKVLDKDTS